jgi:uncharacterized protein (DUF302 family)
MPAIKRELELSYDDVLDKLPEELKKEGFGVLTEIDVKETLKKKLDVDFRRYKILGACNPPIAHRALNTDLDVGVLLPCNVLVYEGDGGKTVVSAVDPEAAMSPFGEEELAELAKDVRTRLSRALEAL